MDMSTAVLPEDEDVDGVSQVTVRCAYMKPSPKDLQTKQRPTTFLSLASVQKRRVGNKEAARCFPRVASDEKSFRKAFPESKEDWMVIHKSQKIDPEVPPGTRFYHGFESLYWMVMCILVGCLSSTDDKEQSKASFEFLQGIASVDNHVTKKAGHFLFDDSEAITRMLPHEFRFLANTLYSWQQFVSVEWGWYQTGNNSAISHDILFRAQLLILYRICRAIADQGHDIRIRRNDDRYGDPSKEAAWNAEMQDQNSVYVPESARKKQKR